jgi:hypothetical protein
LEIWPLKGKAAVGSFKRPFVLAWFVAFAGGLSIAQGSRAADWAFGPAPLVSEEDLGRAGIPCSAGAPFWAPPAATAEELPWPSVWLGHFSGGRPYWDPYYDLTLIDWLDLKVCFPARRACEAWVNGLRRAYHQPEGYWTCLLLR